MATLWFYQDSLLLAPGKALPGPHALTLGGGYLGEVWEPTAPAKATVVFFHGNGGTVADRRFIAEAATALGYRAVLIEYQGYGARAGKARMETYGRRSIADFDLVRVQYPREPIILLGESYGSGMAAVVAGARAEQVCAVTLVVPWNRLSALIQEKLPVFPARVLLKTDYRSDEALQGYRGQVTVVGAELDSLIPVHHARTLASRHPGSTFELLQGVGHNDWSRLATAEQWKRWLSCSRI